MEYNTMSAVEMSCVIRHGDVVVVVVAIVVVVVVVVDVVGGKDASNFLHQSCNSLRRYSFFVVGSFFALYHADFTSRVASTKESTYASSNIDAVVVVGVGGEYFLCKYLNIVCVCPISPTTTRVGADDSVVASVDSPCFFKTCNTGNLFKLALK
jgi:hypothetical protein